MDSSFLYLVAGFLAGTLASGLLFFWISNQNKKKQDASLEKRNQIIHSIAEIFTDIDSLITSFRTDLLSEDKFRTSLYSKLDAANKIYKPNMHLLDLYYVKFTDMQFARYHQLAHRKLTNLQLDGQMAFDNEIDSIDKSSDLIHSSGSDKSDSQSPVGFFTDKPDKDSSKVFIQTKYEELNSTDDKCVMDDKDDKIPDFEFVSMGLDENQVVVEEQPVVADHEQPAVMDDEQPLVVEEQPVIVNDEQPLVVEEQPVIVNDEQSLVVEEQPVIANDEQSAIIADEQSLVADEKPPVICDEEPEVVDEELSAVGDSKEAEDFGDEIVFEVNPDKATDKKESPFISSTTIEVSKNARPDDTTDGLVDESAQEQKSAFQQEFEQVAKEPQDEEMLETIMDLDMGKFLRTGSINIENIDKNALPPKYAASGRGTDESVKKVAQVKKEDSFTEEPQKTIQSTKETEDQEKIVIARGDDGGLDTILDEVPADAESNNKAGDVNDVSITGDDVASKIDSFFGIK